MVSLISAPVVADDIYLYRVVVDGVDPLLPEQIIYGDWMDVGSPYSCSTWLPSLSEHYIGDDVNQSRSCKQDQERTITTKTCSVSGKCSETETTDYFTDTVKEKQVEKGTKLYSYSISSCGYDDSCSRSTMIFHETTTNAGRSWQLMVIDPGSNQIDAIKKYDVYRDISNAYAMRDYLRAIPSGKLVMINTWDEPYNNSYVFTNELVNYFGANQLGTITTRDSYILMGYKNGKKLHEMNSNRYGSGVSTGTHEIDP